MTSNLGNEVIKQYSIGFGGEEENNKKEAARTKEMREKVDKILKEHFKLEFLNRIDEIVLFKSLKEEDLANIVDLELDKVSQRLQAKNIKLKLNNKVKKFLAEKGYDISYGARPLKRVIQSLILDELALQIIENKIKEGDKINISVSNDNEIKIEPVLSKK
jgi:ATP-dependent Clp protease ATP-binding subunit ClpA